MAGPGALWVSGAGSAGEVLAGTVVGAGTLWALAVVRSRPRVRRKAARVERRPRRPGTTMDLSVTGKGDFGGWVNRRRGQKQGFDAKCGKLAKFREGFAMDG
jgi:hypothetical protein